MTQQVLSSTSMSPVTTGAMFISLDDWLKEVEVAFNSGLKYGQYRGVAQFASDAGSVFTWFGSAEFRGNATAKVYLDSLLAAAKEGYLDGGERRLPSINMDFVPKLTEPDKKLVQGLMDFITVGYVTGFELGRVSFKTAGIADPVSQAGQSMLSSEGNWGEWFLGTAALAALVAVGVVFYRKSQKGA